MNTLFENGLHIPFLYFIFYLVTDHHLISYSLMMKLFSINYYYNFNEKFKSLTFIQSQIKPWVRFTDTGYIASLIYYMYPSFFPIAFNVHFTISIGYWCTMTFFKITDNDSFDKCSLFYNYFHKLMSYLLHTIPLALLFTDMCTYKNKFDDFSMYYSILWGISWIFFILIPWKYFTKDSIYTIFNDNVSINRKILIIFIMFSIINLSNNIGEQYCLYLC